MNRRTLQALANEHRVTLLRRLKEGPKTYSDLIRAVGFDPERDRGKFTYHLNILRGASLVDQRDGLYHVTSAGEEALTAFDAPEAGWQQPPSFAAYYARLDGGERVVVGFLLASVGLYLLLGFWGVALGVSIGFLVVFVLGFSLILVAVVALVLAVRALPGGSRFRRERALLFVLAAGIWASLPPLTGFRFLPPIWAWVEWVTWIALAVTLGLLGYRHMEGRAVQHLLGGC